MVEKTSPRKFGSIAGTIGFGFVVFGIALYQIVLRDYVPLLTVGDGWYDWGRSLGAGVCGVIDPRAAVSFRSRP